MSVNTSVDGLSGDRLIQGDIPPHTDERFFGFFLVSWKTSKSANALKE